MPSRATRRKMDRHQASFKSRLRGAFSREKSRNSPKLFGKNNTDGFHSFHRRIFRVERERNMKHSTGGSTQGSAIPAWLTRKWRYKLPWVMLIEFALLRCRFFFLLSSPASHFFSTRSVRFSRAWKSCHGKFPDEISREKLFHRGRYSFFCSFVERSESCFVVGDNSCGNIGWNDR